MTTPISQSSAGSAVSGPPPGAGAEALIAAHSEHGVVRVEALAQALSERAQSDPEHAAQLRAEIEARLSPTDDAALARACEALAAPPQDGGEGFGAVIEGAVQGDFSDNDSWSKLAGQVGVGFIPVAGQIADARDTGAALQGVWNGEDGAWGDLAMAGVAWIPGLGDAAKGLLRGGDKAAAELGGEAVEGTVRLGDEAAAGTARGANRDVIELEAGGKGAWNDTLNAPLRANADYHVNDYVYKTDSEGRVASVEGELRLEQADRNTYQQGKAADRGLPGDQGGHWIASIFDGPGEAINLYPQNGNFNMGEWRSLEHTWQEALEQGKHVEVKIEGVYNDDSVRPDRIMVRYSIDGDAVTRSFFNRPGG